MESIVFSVDSPNSPIKIYPATTINHEFKFYRISYKIDTTQCPVGHILTSTFTKFIALYHAGVIHIFNLKEDGAFPDDFKMYIESIRDKLTTYFTREFTADFRVANAKQIQMQICENAYDFVPIRSPASWSYYCDEMKELVDLKDAKEKIKQLNGLLKETCPGFYLRIDYITPLTHDPESFPENSNIYLLDESLHQQDQHLNSFFTYSQIVLCLFTGNQCVSSICMNLIKYSSSRSEVYINSRTNPEYKERKFNKLLRAVAIIISKNINSTIDTLASITANTLSAVIMQKSFNAQADGRESRLKLTHENIENAERVFMELIKTENADKRIKCDKTAVAAARTLGIDFKKGGKQTKKRSGHKRSGHKRSGHKRSGHKRSGHGMF